MKGYVIIDIMEEKGARLLTLCAEHGIRLWNVTPSSAYCSVRNWQMVSDICQNSGIAVTIAREVSFRKTLASGVGGLLAGGIVIIFFFIAAAGYVWEIEVNGCREEVAGEVLAVLEEQGLTVGVRKSSLPSGNALRDSIIYNIDGINWAWVYLDGTLARVEVSYKLPHEPVITKGEPCNITAVRDGVILSVSATSGRKTAAVGQTVSAGDILISGAMPGGTLTAPYTVCAEGEVLAETVHTKSCSVPLVKTYTADTGEVFVRRAFRLFELEIPLGFNKSPDFEQYRVEKTTPPVGICTYRYIGTESITEQIPSETAVSEAAEALAEEIAHELTSGARKTDEQVRFVHSGAGFVNVTLTMNFIENIGIETPVQLWQTEELTNDKTD
ncbi:MAG: sporulation protein YqfD [Clostridia bacterium]|nr:sporulation protein YqfD [Clostridia bacterium]